MNSWVMAEVFYEVTQTKFLSVHPLIKLNNCAKFEEILSNHYRDITFTRIRRRDRQLENIMPSAMAIDGAEA